MAAGPGSLGQQGREPQHPAVDRDVVGKDRVAEYTALWFIANLNRVEKGGDHDGTVKR
jgi:hypothetical protein